MSGKRPADRYASELPSVSVIVVNLNGRGLLRDCLGSIAAQDYPPDQVETILVDNGSLDDSVPFVRKAYPWVQIVETGRNLGFAAGSNLGARIAQGTYLAFLNNDARAAPDWLEAMVTAASADPEVACIASKILDWEGQTIDFVGTRLNLSGRAFQLDEGMPVTAGWYDEPRELLAPCGAAMMIRQDVFWQVGGFDEDFVSYYEDVDLGWRLWLYGHSVIFAPQAVVFHKQHQTGWNFPVEQRNALSEANALRMLIKNLDEENLSRVLPFSLFMGVKRAVEQAGLDRASYRFGTPAKGDPEAGAWLPEKRMTRLAASLLVAIDQIGEELPSLLQARQCIQSARLVSDEEIFARFPICPGSPISPRRRYHLIQDQLAESLGVPDVLRPGHGSRLLIITHEAIGPYMAGPGIRAWEMACALAEQFEVLLAAPGEPGRHHHRVRLLSYDPDDPRHPRLRRYLDNADVVLIMGPLLSRLPLLQALGKPTIVDLYDPFELETLASSGTVDGQHRSALDRDRDTSLSLQARAGDFYICASERQRDFWLGTLLANQRVNSRSYAQDPTMRALIDVVPYGMPQHPPEKQRQVLKGIHPGIAQGDKLLFWNGGLWQWLDPLTLIDAMPLVLANRDDVKLCFAAGRHFNSEIVPEMPVHAQVLDRSRALGLLDTHVFMGDWIPYDERASYLLEADLGISTHRATIESRFASRARILDCLWAGLPVLSTAGDHLSDMLVQRGLGRAVPPEQPDLLAEAILEMLANDDYRHRAAEQAQALREEFAWSRCVQPIADFLGRGAFAPDALQATLRGAEAWRERQEMQQRIHELETHLAEIRRGRLLRLIRAVKVALGRE